MPDELTMVPGEVSGEPRPVWEWTNELRNPTTLHLEPSFKPELGLAYLQLGRGDNALGIWLPDDVIESLRAGLDAIAEHSRRADANI